MASTLTLEFVLYRVTCNVTGKSYIGQTCQKLRMRWNHHKHMARTKKSSGCSALHAAMRKYGIEAFKIEVIATYATQDAINEAEASRIASENTLAPNGYNLKAGGRNSKHSPETIAKMKAKARLRGGRPAGFKHSAETRQLMSQAARAAVQEGVHNLIRENRAAETEGRRLMGYRWQRHLS